MTSSISSADDSAGPLAAASDAAAEEHHAIHRRETASDRPGVAQPVPKRPVPDQPWGRIFVGMLLLLAGMLGAWEWHWRDFGVAPSIRNTDALWAIQRRRIDNGEGDATLIVASSRLFFDLQLDVWEKLDGKRRSSSRSKARRRCRSWRISPPIRNSPGAFSWGSRRKFSSAPTAAMARP